jgi:sirohydrochlorin cobaltochelatase
MSKRALILFAHGARAASWAAPFERLRTLAQARMPDVHVSLAFLEFMTPQLPDLVPELVRSGIERITVVPVFLGQGGHVLRDLPAMVEQLRAAHPEASIRVAEAAGENAAVLNAICDYCLGALDQP